MKEYYVFYEIWVNIQYYQSSDIDVNKQMESQVGPTETEQ